MGRSWGLSGPRAVWGRGAETEGSPMTSQWKTRLRKDSGGSTIVGFSLEGKRGHIQMDAPAGSLDPGDFDDDQLDRLRSRAKSCTISWMDDAGVDWVVEVRVSAGRIMVFKVNGNGPVLAVGMKVQGGIGDQDPVRLISHVRSLV